MELPLKFALEVVKARFLEIIFFNISLNFLRFFNSVFEIGSLFLGTSKKGVN